VSPGPYEVAFVHDSRRFDGLLVDMEVTRAALEGPSARVRVYTCFDPSLRAEYPELGTMVAGHRLPGGGDVERGLNRWFPVFARKLRRIPESPVHIWSISLAAFVRYRPDVVLTLADIGKFTTRYYGRVASYLHNRMLPYLPRARAIVCNTEWARAELLEALRLPAARVHVAPPCPPIGPPPFPLPRTPAPPTPAAPWTLLGVAVDRPHKNLGFFLRVLARTDRRFRGLLITRPTRATLDLAQHLGVSDRVEYRAGVADLAPVYRAAHVLVHPSLHEGFGLPLLEAMSQGLPVVASNRTCIPEVVGDGGVLLDPEDPGVWAESVERLTDPARYREASRYAADRAAIYSPERTRNSLLAVYAASAP
jgi:glycosyltransferase involved in cell wall biosynthesis